MSLARQVAGALSTVGIGSFASSSSVCNEALSKKLSIDDIRGGVVLAHGMCNPATAAIEDRMMVQYFGRVSAFLARHNFEVLMPRVPAMGHVEERAESLHQQILEWGYYRAATQRRPVPPPIHVIGHSMGGLDARYMISRLGGHEIVSSLCTVSTPHRGSVIADMVCERPYLESLIKSVLTLGAPLSAIHCLRRDYVTHHFNEACPDHPDVEYYSVSGTKGPDVSAYCLPLKVSFPYMLEAEGPNDGIVSVKSAIWGHHLGTYHLDHMDQIDTPYTGDANKQETWRMWEDIGHHVLGVDRTELSEAARLISPGSFPVEKQEIVSASP